MDMWHVDGKEFGASKCGKLWEDKYMEETNGKEGLA